MARPLRMAGMILAVLVSLVVVGFATGYVGTYNGLNKGVTVGSCGFEIVGVFGPFCGDY